MPRPRKKATARKQQYGTVNYNAPDDPHSPGLPFSFLPAHGVGHRLKTLEAVEREYRLGRLSPEDLERSRAAWEVYRKRMGW